MLLNLFIKDLHAFRIVEGIGFREFIETLNPLYETCLNNTKSLVQSGKTVCPLQHIHGLPLTQLTTLRLRHTF